MHFVQAKRLLSKDNGMNIYRGCSHGAFTATAGAGAMVLHMHLKILR